MTLLKYIGKRLVYIAISIVVVIILTYILMYSAPGNFFDIQRFQMSSSASSSLTQEQIEILRRGFEDKYGINKPLHEQIINYVINAAQFKFGPSFMYPNNNIEDLIAKKFPVTLTLGLLAIILAILVGIPLGVLAALKRNTWVDYTSTTFAMIGQVIPAYVIGVLLVFVFAVNLRWLPATGWGNVREMILPVLAVSLGPMAVIARFTRISLLDTLNQDYIRTAYAKGGTVNDVVRKHALKNSLIPIATVVGPNLAYILAGSAVYIENQFRVPGIGSLFIKAAQWRDYPLLVTSTFVLALTIMLMNLIVDLVYALLDPRIKLK